MRTIATLCGALMCASLMGVVIDAQWLNYKTPGVPRTPDGKPRLDAPAPRFLDGHPDLSGVWMHELTPVAELRRLYGAFIDEEIKNELPGMEAGNVQKYLPNILADFTPDNTPARPETQAIFARRISSPSAENLCVSTGVPPFLFHIAGLVSEPIKIAQAPRLTMIMYEVGDSYRQIYTDGRTLPNEINLPAYNGYSAGRWERDTFVVETAGFNDKTRLDVLGHPHSDQLRVLERFRRRDFGHLDTEMTFDDPKMYTRPFTITIAYRLLADQDIFEMFDENEKDCAHIRAGAQAK
jgi:hypothetical protein